MKFYAFLACLLAAWNCLDKAVGTTSQVTFSQDVIWLWWVPTIFWACVSITNLWQFIMEQDR